MELGTAKGKSASMGTTQGEMDVPKFFPRKGPRGTYSHAWMSLAENEHKYYCTKKKSRNYQDTFLMNKVIKNSLFVF